MSLVSLRIDGAVATLELQRQAKRNALDTSLRDAIEAALAELCDDARVKVVILTGGDACFSAGYDLDEMRSTGLGALFHRFEEYTEAIWLFPKPLITAVAGVALAGGFDLALAGDHVIAAEGARFGRPEIGWGISPLMSRLGARIGPRDALAFTWRGDVVDARDALALRLIDRVVPLNELLPTARALAEQTARHPLSALMATKRAAYGVLGMNPRDAIRHELALLRELAAEGALQQSLDAFAQRVQSSKA